MLLVAQLVFSSFGQVRVLCVGNDGHISVEQAHDVCDQASAPNHSSHATPVSSSATATCFDGNLQSCEAGDTDNCMIDCVASNPCNDIPLPANGTHIILRDQTPGDSLVPAASLMFWTGERLPVALNASVFARPAFDPHQPYHRSQTQRSLAAVILLI